MSVELAYAERLPDGPAEGLVILHHGRGSDEHDLVSLADALDPQGRLHFVTPRAPLQFAGMPGNHWYVVPRVGYPDPASFGIGYGALAAFHDAVWARTEVEPSRTVLGGFSQGTVMSYALGLGPGRPTVAGILAISGFIPVVAGWDPDFAGHSETSVLLAHGRRDPVIGVEFGRLADETLTDAGLEHEYLESDAGHHIDPGQLPVMSGWLHSRLAVRPRAGGR